MAVNSISARTWAELDREAIRHNLAVLKEQLSSGVQVMAVVKANAYGHGVEWAVRALRSEVEWFGVANVSEAQEIAGLAAGNRILVLGPALAEERAALVGGGFTPVISDFEEARAYAALSGKSGVGVHLAVDSGMGRLGVWETEAVELAKACQTLKGMRVTGLCTHLPSADEDDDYTLQQLARFQALVHEMRSMKLFDGPVHVENSAAALAFPSDAGDLVRAGLMLYGCSPRPEFQNRLQSVMRWKARITLVRAMGVGRTVSYGRTFVVDRPSRVATVAVGYADGYPRHLSGQGAEVLIQGTRCPVLGRVTMDQLMVDVSALASVGAGEEVLLMGRDGEQEIGAWELAQKSGTIPWEIFTGLGRRVVRVGIGAV
jgi:alanine racemase